MNQATQQQQQQLLQKLQDPKWRMRNLYYIKDKKGRKVLFQPTAEQEYLEDNIWWFNIIPKARQLGITTFFCIYYLDAILFSSNQNAVIIAHTREAAKKIFKDKIKFAWDNLPDWVKQALGEATTDTAQEMTFANGSTISVTTSARSGTVQYLHISEFGKICAKYPEKAEEIVTGSINTVDAESGLVSIESTAEGREGYFYDFCMDAEKNQKEGKVLSPLEFKLFFFPWWQHKGYRDSTKTTITEEHKEYFKDLEIEAGILLDQEQKNWWVQKKAQNRDNMFREYPATLEEAFKASIEGAYYASEMARVYEHKRITRVPHIASEPVDTWWDLGMNDLNVIIFTQTIGSAIHIIDVYANQGEGLAHYVNVLRDRGYTYGRHTLPHDVEVRDLSSGKTRKATLHELGLWDIRVGAKAPIIDGIEKTRKMFSRFYFDAERTATLYNALSMYRKEWDDNKGVFKNTPRHDESSHYADALRLLAMEYGDFSGYERIKWLDSDEQEEISEDNFFSL